jgi:hypothetical protein
VVSKGRLVETTDTDPAAGDKAHRIKKEGLLQTPAGRGLGEYPAAELKEELLQMESRYSALYMS